MPPLFQTNTTAAPLALPATSAPSTHPSSATSSAKAEPLASAPKKRSAFSLFSRKPPPARPDLVSASTPLCPSISGGPTADMPAPELELEPHSPFVAVMSGGRSHALHAAPHDDDEDDPSRARPASTSRPIAATLNDIRTGVSLTASPERPLPSLPSDSSQPSLASLPSYPPFPAPADQGKHVKVDLASQFLHLPLHASDSMTHPAGLSASVSNSTSLGGISASTSRNTVIPASHPIMSTSISGRELGVGPRAGSTSASTYLPPSLSNASSLRAQAQAIGGAGGGGGGSVGRRGGMRTLGSAIHLDGHPGAQPHPPALGGALDGLTDSCGPPVPGSIAHAPVKPVIAGIAKLAEADIEANLHSASPPPAIQGRSAASETPSHSQTLPRSTSGTSIFTSYRGTRRASGTTPSGGGESLGRRLSRRLSIDGLRPLLTSGNRRRSVLELGKAAPTVAVAVAVAADATANAATGNSGDIATASHHPAGRKDAQRERDTTQKKAKDKMVLPGLRSWRSRFKSSGSGAGPGSGLGPGSSAGAGSIGRTAGETLAATQSRASTHRGSVRGERERERDRESWIDMGSVRSTMSRLSARSGDRRSLRAAGMGMGAGALKRLETGAGVGAGAGAGRAGRVVGSGSEFENMHRRSQLVDPLPGGHAISQASVANAPHHSSQAALALVHPTTTMGDTAAEQLSTPTAITGSSAATRGLISHSTASLHAPTVYSLANTSRLSPAMDDMSMLDPSQSRRSSPEPPVPSLPVEYRTHMLAPGSAAGSGSGATGKGAMVSSHSLNALDRVGGPGGFGVGSLTRKSSLVEIGSGRIKGLVPARRLPHRADGSPLVEARVQGRAEEDDEESRGGAVDDCNDEADEDDCPAASRPMSMMTEAEVMVATRHERFAMSRSRCVSGETTSTAAASVQAGMSLSASSSSDVFPREDSTRTFHTARSIPAFPSPSSHPGATASPTLGRRQSATPSRLRIRTPTIVGLPLPRSPRSPRSARSAKSAFSRSPRSPPPPGSVRSMRSANGSRGGTTIGKRTPAVRGGGVEGITASPSLIDRIEKEQGEGWWSVSRPVNRDANRTGELGNPCMSGHSRRQSSPALQPLSPSPVPTSMRSRSALDARPSIIADNAMRALDSPRKSILRQPLRFDDKNDTPSRSGSARTARDAGRSGTASGRGSPLPQPAGPVLSLTRDSPSPSDPAHASSPHSRSHSRSHSRPRSHTHSQALALALAPAATLTRRDTTLQALRDKHELELDTVLDALRQSKRERERLVRENAALRDRLSRRSEAVELVELAETQVLLKRRTVSGERREWIGLARANALEAEVVELREQMQACPPCREWLERETEDERERRFEIVENRALCEIMNQRGPLRIRDPSRLGSSPSFAPLSSAASISAAVSADFVPPPASPHIANATRLPVDDAKNMLSPTLPTMPSDELLTRTTPLVEITDQDALLSRSMDGKVGASGGGSVADLSSADIIRKGSMSVDLDAGEPAPQTLSKEQHVEELRESAGAAAADEFGRLAPGSLSILAHERAHCHRGAGAGVGASAAADAAVAVAVAANEKRTQGMAVRDRAGVTTGSEAADTSFESSIVGSEWELRLRSEDEHHLSAL